MVQAAIDGAGVALAAEERAADHLAKGARSRHGGLDAALSGLFSLLSPSKAAACSADGGDRNVPIVELILAQQSPVGDRK